MREIICNLILGAGGGVAVAFCVLRFFGKTFVEKYVSISLKEKQHELDREIEKLKAANVRISHIMTSLYTEEKEAIKEIAELITLAVIKAYRLHHSIFLSDEEFDAEFESLRDIFDSLTTSTNKNRVLIEDRLYQQIAEATNTAWNYAGDVALCVENKEDKDLFHQLYHGNCQSSSINERGLTLIRELDKIVGSMREYIEGKKREYMEY